MAHRTNVTQVIAQIEQRKQKPVVDPICGKQIDRNSSKNMIFRGDTTYYFCSKECQTRFIYPKHREAS